MSNNIDSLYWYPFDAFYQTLFFPKNVTEFKQELFKQKEWILNGLANFEECNPTHANLVQTETKLKVKNKSVEVDISLRKPTTLLSQKLNLNEVQSYILLRRWTTKNNVTDLDNLSMEQLQQVICYYFDQRNCLLLIIHGVVTRGCQGEDQSGDEYDVICKEFLEKELLGNQNKLIDNLFRQLQDNLLGGGRGHKSAGGQKQQQQQQQYRSSALIPYDRDSSSRVILLQDELQLWMKQSEQEGVYLMTIFMSIYFPRNRSCHHTTFLQLAKLFSKELFSLPNPTLLQSLGTWLLLDALGMDKLLQNVRDGTGDVTVQMWTQRFNINSEITKWPQTVGNACSPVLFAWGAFGAVGKQASQSGTLGPQDDSYESIAQSAFDMGAFEQLILAQAMVMTHRKQVFLSVRERICDVAATLMSSFFMIFTTLLPKYSDSALTDTLITVLKHCFEGSEQLCVDFWSCSDEQQLQGIRQFIDELSMFFPLTQDKLMRLLTSMVHNDKTAQEAACYIQTKLQNYAMLHTPDDNRITRVWNLYDESQDEKDPESARRKVELNTNIVGNVLILRKGFRGYQVNAPVCIGNGLDGYTVVLWKLPPQKQNVDPHGWLLLLSTTVHLIQSHQPHASSLLLVMDFIQKLCLKSCFAGYGLQQEVVVPYLSNQTTLLQISCKALNKSIQLEQFELLNMALSILGSLANSVPANVWKEVIASRMFKIQNTHTLPQAVTALWKTYHQIEKQQWKMYDQIEKQQQLGYPFSLALIRFFGNMATFLRSEDTFNHCFLVIVQDVVSTCGKWAYQDFMQRLLMEETCALMLHSALQIESPLEKHLLEFFSEQGGISLIGCLNSILPPQQSFLLQMNIDSEAVEKLPEAVLASCSFLLCLAQRCSKSDQWRVVVAQLFDKVLSNHSVKVAEWLLSWLCCDVNMLDLGVAMQNLQLIVMKTYTAVFKYASKEQQSLVSLPPPANEGSEPQKDLKHLLINMLSSSTQTGEGQLRISTACEFVDANIQYSPQILLPNILCIPTPQISSEVGTSSNVGQQSAATSDDKGLDEKKDKDVLSQLLTLAEEGSMEEGGDCSTLKHVFRILVSLYERFGDGSEFARFLNKRQQLWKAAEKCILQGDIEVQGVALELVLASYESQVLQQSEQSDGVGYWQIYNRLTQEGELIQVVDKQDIGMNDAAWNQLIYAATMLAKQVLIVAFQHRIQCGEEMLLPLPTLLIKECKDIMHVEEWCYNSKKYQDDQFFVLGQKIIEYLLATAVDPPSLSPIDAHNALIFAQDAQLKEYFENDFCDAFKSYWNSRESLMAQLKICDTASMLLQPALRSWQSLQTQIEPGDVQTNTCQLSLCITKKLEMLVVTFQQLNSVGAKFEILNQKERLSQRLNSSQLTQQFIQSTDILNKPDLLSQIFTTLNSLVSLAKNALVLDDSEYVFEESQRCLESSGDFEFKKSKVKRRLLFSPGSSPQRGQEGAGDSPERDDLALRGELTDKQLKYYEQFQTMFKILDSSIKILSQIFKVFENFVEPTLELVNVVLEKLGRCRGFNMHAEHEAVVRGSIRLFGKLGTQAGKGQIQGLSLVNLNLSLQLLQPSGVALQKIVTQIDFDGLLQLPELPPTQQSRIAQKLMSPILTIAQSEEGARVLFHMGLGDKVCSLSRSIAYHYEKQALQTYTSYDIPAYTTDTPPLANPLFEMWLQALQIITQFAFNLSYDLSLKAGIAEISLTYYSFHAEYLHQATEQIFPESHQNVELHIMQLQNCESSLLYFLQLLNFRGDWLVNSPRGTSRVRQAASRFIGFFADFVRSSFQQIQCQPKTSDEKLLQRSQSKLNIQQGIVSEIVAKSSQNDDGENLWSPVGGSSTGREVSVQRWSGENFSDSAEVKQSNEFIDATVQSLYGSLLASLMFLCTLADALEADSTTLSSKEWPRRDDLLMVQQECVTVTQDWNDQEGCLKNSQIRLLAQKMIPVLKCSQWIYKSAGHKISSGFQQEVITCVGFLERLAV